VRGERNNYVRKCNSLFLANSLLSPRDIWLKRLKTCPFHIKLTPYGMDPQYFHILTSSIRNIRLFQRSADKELVDLTRQHIPLSCPRRLELLCASSSVWEIPEDIFALMGATTNLPKPLRITSGIGLHCTYARLIDSIVNHLSHLLSEPVEDCECTWTDSECFSIFVVLSWTHLPSLSTG